MMKYEFLVHPGADPSRIRLAYRGVDAVEVNGEGRLEVKTPAGDFEDDRPVGYQELDGKRMEVGLRYALEEEATNEPGPTAGEDATKSYVYGFDVGDYDRTKPLVLDPAVLVYCGYIGGSGYEHGYGIAVDASGNAYVTGQGGPSAIVGPDLTPNGHFDAFVAKVNAAGTALVYCGYIGGSDEDVAYDIAVDGAGNAYVIGSTISTEATFPVLVGPDLTYNGNVDVFVAKVNAAGTALDYCGYIGGSGNEGGIYPYLSTTGGIGVDGSGNAYVAGYVRYDSAATFPVTGGPDLIWNSGFYDGFVAKINADGTALDYCGFIGGTGDDLCDDIAVDHEGGAYVTGTTNSAPTVTPGDNKFPVLSGPFLTYGGGYYDSFVAKINHTDGSLEYCGYIGGSKRDYGTSIAVDGAGRAYVLGYTSSTESTFPVLVGPDLIFNDDYSNEFSADAFVARVNASGSGLDYCGYIGGDEGDFPEGIAVDGSYNAYVTGYTGSTEATFPVIGGPDLTHNNPSGNDAFVAKVNDSGSALVYCGYIGGLNGDEGYDIEVDGSGNAYIVGDTGSGPDTFPVIAGPSLTAEGAFVAKVYYAETLATLGVTSPNGGESWIGGTAHDITWTSTGTIANVKLDYSTNGGTVWTTIVASTANTNSYAWTLPVVASANCLIRVSDAAIQAINDASDAAFTIVFGVLGSERAVLIDLYNATNGDSWTNKTGWKTAPLHTDGFALPGTENTWYGVATNAGITTVLNLSLANNNLVGILPSSLGNLSNLQVLDLKSNQLTGGIPAELGNLGNLVTLWLAFNHLSGSVPTALGNLSHLQYLLLHDNLLSGGIPSSLGGLSNLKELWLQNNQLTGTIPAQLGNLGNLLKLGLFLNPLSGSIPPELGNLIQLRELWLYHNQLTGTIPAQLGNLGNLLKLGLYGNQLSGSIPPELGNLSQLRELWLYHNQLTGTIPAQLGNLGNLLKLGLYENQLTGTIPLELANLGNLTELWVFTNQLSGTIPAQLANLVNLTALDFYDNDLTGSIPPALGTLVNLRHFDFSTNQLSGTIPPELGNLGNLTQLRLGSNQLTGGIPAELGNLGQLTFLELYMNQLTGTIPPELGSLSNLTYLGLQANQLTGGIPSEFGLLSKLESLVLRSNQLAGGIPVELGNLSNLKWLYLHTNRLSGEIPTQIGNLADLTDLDLHSNQLSGRIPASLSSLTNLSPTVTNIGYNALYSEDAGLTAFLDSKNPDWASTQTVAPTGVSAAPGAASATVSWAPIAYAGDPGGYRVFFGTTAGGPYTFYAQTADKTTTSQVVSGLTNGTPYYFVVQTRTDVHANNLNIVDSGNSLEATATPVFVPVNTLTVTSPNGGEVWAGGSPQAITWTSTGAVGNVIVEYSTNGGGAWTTIIASTANDGTHPWTVPNVPSTNCLVRVSETDGSPSDVNDTVFTITTGATVKEDLVGTWDGQAVYYRNSTSGLWTILASPADLIACGDLFGDGKDDVIGIWASQAGVWAKSSADASWTHLSSTARHIAAGDMNGDGRVDFLGAWDGQGVYYRDSISGVWTQIATPADLITAGDLDGDGTDDLIGIWSGQAGVWVKFSQSGDWTYLGSSASDIATADMNGDGRADLLGTWVGQGVFYRNSMNGVWTQLATPADLIAAGDLDGDGSGDLIGIWAGQAGVWVRYSQTQTWTFIASSARDIDAGKMSTGNWSAGSAKIQEFAWPMGGFAEGPGSGAFVDVSAEGPGGRYFAPQVERHLMPPHPPALWNRIPGPGEPGFRCGQQQNLIPGQGGTEKKK
jgi:Leucine-rich repeat (LRR) protein